MEKVAASLPPLLKRAFSLRKSSSPDESSTTTDDPSNSATPSGDGVTSPTGGRVAPTSSTDALEAQTLASLSPSSDNIWAAIRNGNFAAVRSLIDKNTK